MIQQKWNVLVAGCLCLFLFTACGSQQTTKGADATALQQQTDAEAKAQAKAQVEAQAKAQAEAQAKAQADAAAAAQAAATAKAQQQPAPVKQAAAPQMRYNPNGGDRDCPDFSTHDEAQAFFIAAGGPARDPHRLDADHDGLACEQLP